MGGDSSSELDWEASPLMGGISGCFSEVLPIKDQQEYLIFLVSQHHLHWSKRKISKKESTEFLTELKRRLMNVHLKSFMAIDSPGIQMGHASTMVPSCLIVF